MTIIKPVNIIIIFDYQFKEELRQIGNLKTYNWLNHIIFSKMIVNSKGDD